MSSCLSFSSHYALPVLSFGLGFSLVFIHVSDASMHDTVYNKPVLLQDVHVQKELSATAHKASPPSCQTFFTHIIAALLTNCSHELSCAVAVMVVNHMSCCRITLHRQELCLLIHCKLSQQLDVLVQLLDRV